MNKPTDTVAIPRWLWAVIGTLAASLLLSMGFLYQEMRSDIEDNHDAVALNRETISVLEERTKTIEQTLETKLAGIEKVQGTIIDSLRALDGRITDLIKTKADR